METDENNEVTPEHLRDRGEFRVVDFAVPKELLSTLVCDTCGGQLPRDAIVVHEDNGRDDKGDMQVISYIACTQEHAQNLIIARKVEKNLTEKDETK